MVRLKENSVIQRRTQTERYWREQFQVTGQDLARIYDLILDAAKPVASSVLARALIEDACRREEAQIQAELSKGPAYQPADGVCSDMRLSLRYCHIWQLRSVWL